MFRVQLLCLQNFTLRSETLLINNGRSVLHALQLENRSHMNDKRRIKKQMWQKFFLSLVRNCHM